MTQIPLSDLVATLGPAVVRVVCAPTGLAHVAGNPEFFDTTDPTPTAPSALLLGIGLWVDAPQTRKAVHTAARNQAAALVVKSYGRPTTDLCDTARECGLAILDAEPDLPWPRLEALCAMVVRRDPGPPPAGLAQVPHGDLFSLANAVAAIVGGAVAIMDVSYVVLAYSSLQGQPIDDTRRRGILDRRVPADALESFLNPAVWRSGSVVRVRRPGDMDRLAVVIRAGSEVLGSMWVAVGAASSTGTSTADVDGVDPASAATLAEAAKLAALHMLSLRRHVAEEQVRRNEALRAVLDSGDDPGELEFPARLLALSWHGGSDYTQNRMLGLQVQDMVVLDAAMFGLSVATTLAGDHLYVMVPASSRHGGSGQAAAFAGHLVDRATASLRADLCVVLCGETDTPLGLRTDRTDSADALAHLARTGTRAGVTDIEDLRADLVLYRIARLVAQRPGLRSGVAQRIADHDAAKGSRYADSLRAYLGSFGDIAAAARALPVHQNTLRHRLRRAQELFAIDLARPEHLLLLWLELTAASVAPPRPQH
ncbi:MAG TPA: helix-turn-helix domain-containing protein [Streptosporangiaceae bacterium]|nr:helix-turn-helix domain-containing protein [Streptosporangiaceae bacterium]